MSELRSYSTRARITTTNFVNHYEWGSFKGDGDVWMERYFDAFLNLANEGTHMLKLSLPSRLLDPAKAIKYCGGDRAFIREKAGKVILTSLSDASSREADNVLNCVGRKPALGQYPMYHFSSRSMMAVNSLCSVYFDMYLSCREPDART